jgi:hypothetical protein
MNTTSFHRIQMRPSHETAISPLSSFTSLQTDNIESSLTIPLNIFNSSYPSPAESVIKPTTEEVPFLPFYRAQVDTLPTTVISTEHAKRRISNASSAKRYIHSLILPKRSRARKRNELEDLQRENKEFLGVIADLKSRCENLELMLEQSNRDIVVE